MSAKRTFYAMCLIVALLVIGIFGSAYGVRALLTDKSSQLGELKAKVVALDQQQIRLNKAKKDVEKYTELYEIAKVVVPENKNQAQAVRQIVKIAEENGISLESITFPTSSLGSGPVGATSSGTSAATGKANLSQLTPVPKIPGVYTLQLIVTSSPGKLATYPKLISFLSALEHNRQTALVSSLNIQPDSNNNRLFSFNLTLDIYIKP